MPVVALKTTVGSFKRLAEIAPLMALPTAVVNVDCVAAAVSITIGTLPEIKATGAIVLMIWNVTVLPDPS